MNQQVYNDVALEAILADRFGMKASIKQMIVHEIDVSRTAIASVFMTDKKQLVAFIAGPSKLTLGDVQKIVTRMGLKAELYFPPKHRPDYFDEIGREHVRSTFPGRTNITPDDLRYYRTLAPYNPALVLIQEVREGQIYQYDTDTSGDWRPIAKFAYRRIKTS